MQAMAELYPERYVSAQSRRIGLVRFAAVCGSDQIWVLLSKNMKAADILPYWRKERDETAFR